MQDSPIRIEPGASQFAVHHRLFGLLRRWAVSIWLVITVVVLWCLSYDKITPLKWTFPVGYRCDSIYELAQIRAASEGDYLPLHWKIIKRLGAPNQANWNDYPTSEDLNYALFGMVARLFGLMPAANLALLLPFVLSAIGFYWACSLLHYQRMWSFVGALLFAFSHYAYFRGLDHLQLQNYAHVPLVLVVVHWLRAGVLRQFSDPRVWLALGVGAWSGFQSVYYANIIAQFMAFAICVNLVRASRERAEWRTALIGFVILSTIAGAFIIANADTLTYWWCYGRNTGAVIRNYAGTEILALKPIELLIPDRQHPFSFLRAIGQYYYQVTVVRGEMSSAYLGLVGIVSLFWLGGYAFLRLAKSRSRSLPLGFWEILWIFLYSVVGGVNCLVALFGMNLFRGTDRYSIVILAIVLLFLTRMLGSRTRRWPIALRLGLASLLLIIGIPEQMSGSGREPTRVVAARVESDRAFAKGLEKSLPRGSAIFQLPVVLFPEQGPIGKMCDYDHLRLFLFTHTLRFSYGEDKGRGRELWQFDVQKLPAQAAVELLRRKGFAAVVLDRNAYDDRGASLMADFEKAGPRLIDTSKGGDFTAFALSPPR